MVCTSLGSLLCPLFHFLCSILLIHRVGFFTLMASKQVLQSEGISAHWQHCRQWPPQERERERESRESCTLRSGAFTRSNQGPPSRPPALSSALLAFPWKAPTAFVLPSMTAKGEEAHFRGGQRWRQEEDLRRQRELSYNVCKLTPALHGRSGRVCFPSKRTPPPPTSHSGMIHPSSSRRDGDSRPPANAKVILLFGASMVRTKDGRTDADGRPAA